jgi:hypothetical protein
MESRPKLYTAMSQWISFVLCNIKPCAFRPALAALAARDGRPSGDI